MSVCPACGGTGVSTYRGAACEGYDEPDYVDTCQICGGERVVPASMFADPGAYDDDAEDA